MSTTEPSKWSTALGASADINSLPQTTPAGTGLASLSGLFPQITQIPIDSGGIAPERADFNALFKLLGDTVFFLMQGGIFSYSASYAYRAGDLVMYNGSVYRCIQAHVAGTAAPSNTSYWSAVASTGDIPTKTSQLQNDSGFVTSASVPTKTSQLQNDSGFITSSSLPTVNNGTLTIQQDGATVGTFTANQSGNTTVNITGGGGVVRGGPAILILGIRDLVVSNSTASSQFDDDMHAAGYWRCGVGYADWHGYAQGAKGYKCFIAYAPSGHTVTKLDIDIAKKSVGTEGMNGWESATALAGVTVRTGFDPIDVPSSASAVQNYVTEPTAGMTSASEVAMPHNITTEKSFLFYLFAGFLKNRHLL